MSLEEVLPIEFFRLKQPYSTYLRIQFRDKFSTATEDDESWKEIVFDGKNRFFQNMTVEDAGGFPSVSLSLVDVNFGELESIITKSIVGLGLVNSTYQARREGSLTESQDELRTQDHLRTFLDDTTYPNMRIKFGYNENLRRTDLDPGQMPSNFTEFESRSTELTTYQSPWLYLKILNANFKVTEIGMTAEINAISMLSNILERAKIWRRNAFLVGQPLALLRQLNNWINQQLSADATFVFEFEDEPIYIGPADPVREQDENFEPLGLIDIALGGEESTVSSTRPDGTTSQRRIASFRTLGSLLNEICANVYPKSFKANNVELTAEEYLSLGQREDQEDSGEVSTIERTIRYSYRYEKLSATSHKIIFYYQDPQKSLEEQGKIRNYVWRGNSKSIVKSLSIDSSIDFALINMPIFSFASSSPNAYQVAISRGNESNAGVTNLTTQDVIDAADNIDTISFVGSISDTDSLLSGSSNTLGNAIANRVSNNLANGMFAGTIEIPGDPFYLFGKVIKPFQYLIRITVYRPELEEDDSGQLKNKKSYLSGNYFLKKIIHNIGQDGFNTTLEISKFPDPNVDRNLREIEVE